MSEETVGIECPKCACRHLEVDYGRPKRGGGYQRKRICRNCGTVVFTRETVLFSIQTQPSEPVCSTGVRAL